MGNPEDDVKSFYKQKAILNKSINNPAAIRIA